MVEDSYTATQASMVLGLSTKRIRQLVEEKKLKAIPRSKPLRISAVSVLAERKRRADTNSIKPALNTGSLVEMLEKIEEARNSGYSQGLEVAQRQIEATQHTETITREALFKSEAERKELTERLLETSIRLAQLETQANKKGFFRR